MTSDMGKPDCLASSSSRARMHGVIGTDMASFVQPPFVESWYDNNPAQKVMDLRAGAPRDASAEAPKHMTIIPLTCGITRGQVRPDRSGIVFSVSKTRHGLGQADEWRS